MEAISINQRGKTQEVVSIIVGFLAWFVGLMMVIVPGQDFFFVLIPAGKEFVGLFLVIAGLLGTIEVRAQKRYNALMDALKERTT